MELARNPAMLQELMRSQDRAMSNLEVRMSLLVFQNLALLNVKILLDWVQLFWGLYMALTIFQSYHDLAAGDTPDLGSNPGPLAQQAKSLVILPTQLPIFLCNS